MSPKLQKTDTLTVLADIGDQSSHYGL